MLLDMLLRKYLKWIQNVFVENKTWLFQCLQKILTTVTVTQVICIVLKQKKDLVSINTMELTYIIYDLNKLMNKIEKLVYRIEEEHDEEFDIYIKESIKNIRNRKNIEYNKTYVRIPRWTDLN